MKKIITFAMGLILILSMVGCGRTMDDIIEKEPSVKGTVTEVFDDHFIMLGSPSDDAPAEEYSVSLNVENKDSYTTVAVGDEVVVYYNGKLTDSDPEKMDVVYAIVLRTPANRNNNNKG